MRQVEKFSTWWNNNLSTVISGDTKFTVSLLVCKDTQVYSFKISSNISEFSEAKRKAEELRKNLNTNNPILFVHPLANCSATFDEIINDDWIEKIKLPYREEIKTESGWRGTRTYTVKKPLLNDSIKPLDILWVKKEKADLTGVLKITYFHVGIYLGNGEVCHIGGNQWNLKGIEVVDWDTFIKDCVDGEVSAHRPIIPFKNHNHIAEQVAWTKKNKWRNGLYCLANYNCEHAAKMLVYGINDSKQARENNLVSVAARTRGINNGKSSIDSLVSEINKNDQIIGRLSDQVAKDVKKVITIPKKSDSWHGNWEENLINQQIEILKNGWDTAQSDIDELLNNKDSDNKLINKLQQKLEGTKRRLRDEQIAYKKAQSKLAKLVRELTDSQAELQILQNELWVSRQELNVKQDMVYSLEQERNQAIQAWDTSRRAQIAAELVQNQANHIIQTAQNQLGVANLASLPNLNGRSLVEILAIAEERGVAIAAVSQERDDLVNQRDILQEEISSLSARLRQFQGELTSAASFIQNISGATDLNEFVANLTNLINAQNSFDSRQSLTELLDKVSAYNRVYSKLSGETSDDYLQKLLDAQAGLLISQRKLRDLINKHKEVVAAEKEVKKRLKKEKNNHKMTKKAKEKVVNDLLVEQEKVNNLIKESNDKERQIVRKIIVCLNLGLKEDSTLKQVISRIQELINSPTNSSEKRNKKEEVLKRNFDQTRKIIQQLTDYGEQKKEHVQLTKENLSSSVLSRHYRELTKSEQDKKIVSLQLENKQLISLNDRKKTYIIVMSLITLMTAITAFGLKLKRIRNKGRKN